MANRVRKIRHDDETRMKIQAAQIINRFMACLNGEITLDAQQVSCGKSLLNKILPDLASVDQTNETTIKYVAELPSVIGTTDKWLKAQNRAKTIQ